MLAGGGGSGGFAQDATLLEKSRNVEFRAILSVERKRDAVLELVFRWTMQDFNAFRVAAGTTYRDDRGLKASTVCHRTYHTIHPIIPK